jgi:hypothetical protein
VLEIAEKDNKEVAVARYCLHAVAPVPLADDMLIALVLLRSNEAEYHRIANKTAFERPAQLAAYVEQCRQTHQLQRIATEPAITLAS